jgi:hypothetical protein
MSVSTISSGALRPYMSVVVLQAAIGDTAAAFDEIRQYLRRPASPRSRAQVVLLSEGLEESAKAPAGVDAAVPFVHRVERPPSWHARDRSLTDVSHALSVLVSGGDLIAVLIDGAWSDSLQSWLDKPGRRIRRVPDPVLQRAFLAGETKGLWLSGAHAPLATKPDSKAYAGRRLQDVLNPHADGTYGLAAGRAEMPPSPDRVVLTGNVGTTPGRGLVWSRRCDSLDDFLVAVAELFAEVRVARALPPGTPDVYPVLAGRVPDLSEVSGAYEIGVPDVEDLPEVAADLDRLRSAVDLLQGATLRVAPRGNGTAFTIDVGLDGGTSGQLGGSVTDRNGRRHLDLGWRPETPGDELTTRRVLDALRRVQDRLIVRYRSGHAYMHGDVISSKIRSNPFAGWSWESFDGFRIRVEKPSGDVHAMTAEHGDDSLFGWVVRRFDTGWLTCDDRSGEIADFVHVDPAGVLTLVHVKAAHGDGHRRGVAVVPYQVVVAQAVKNLHFVTDVEGLRRRLADGAPGKACWSHGRRVADRSDLLEALELRDATAPSRVVVVQPHISLPSYRRLAEHRDDAQPTDDVLRLHLVESLLTGAALAVVGRGAQFTVVGSTV